MGSEVSSLKKSNLILVLCYAGKELARDRHVPSSVLLVLAILHCWCSMIAFFRAASCCCPFFPFQPLSPRNYSLASILWWNGSSGLCNLFKYYQWLFSVLYKKCYNTIKSHQDLFISNLKGPWTLSIPLSGPSLSLSQRASVLFPCFPFVF